MRFFESEIESNRLDTLRSRTVTTYIRFFVGILVIVLTIRIIEGNIFHSAICLASIVLIILVHIINKKGYLDLKYSIPFFSFIMTGLVFCIASVGTENKIYITAVLALHMASFIIILHSSFWRYLHIAVCFLAFILTFYCLGLNPIKFMPFMLFLVGFASVFLFYVKFLEKQDQKVEQLIVQQNKSTEELKKANHSLSVKNSDLQTFNQIMSHDLKEPLRTISSFSSLLKRKEGIDSEKREEYFSYIEDSAKRMQTLIDELLMFHNIDNEETKLVDVPLSVVLDDIERSYNEKLKNSKIVLNLSELPVVKGDLVLAKVVFSNLISNAYKYQPKQNQEHIPTVEIWSTKSKDKYFVFVKDNGVGIEEHYIDKLFVPFKRYYSESEYKGTGLGMSICKRVMKKMYGTIELDSTSESGTTFKLTFLRKFEF